MAEVRAKKALGQHFLTDLNIARKIATSLSGGSVEKLGSATAPPGISAEETCQVCCSLTLRKGQTLLLASDGLGEPDISELCGESRTPAALAETLVKRCSGQDDATVVTIQLVSSQT